MQRDSRERLQYQPSVLQWTPTPGCCHPHHFMAKATWGTLPTSVSACAPCSLKCFTLIPSRIKSKRSIMNDLDSAPCFQKCHFTNGDTEASRKQDCGQWEGPFLMPVASLLLWFREKGVLRSDLGWQVNCCEWRRSSLFLQPWQERRALRERSSLAWSPQDVTLLSGSPGREDAEAQGRGEWVAGGASILDEDQTAKQAFSLLHHRPHSWDGPGWVDDCPQLVVGPPDPYLWCECLPRPWGSKSDNKYSLCYSFGVPWTSSYDMPPFLHIHRPVGTLRSNWELAPLDRAFFTGKTKDWDGREWPHGRQVSLGHLPPSSWPAGSFKWDPGKKLTIVSSQPRLLLRVLCFESLAARLGVKRLIA